MSLMREEGRGKRDDGRGMMEEGRCYLSLCFPTELYSFHRLSLQILINDELDDADDRFIWTLSPVPKYEGKHQKHC